MKMGVLSPNMAGFAAQQEFFLNLLKNELTLDAVMQLYLVSHGVHRFILGQSMAKRHFLLDKPFSLARFLLPYGSKQCLRRYLTLQIIPQTLPKKVLGSIGYHKPYFTAKLRRRHRLCTCGDRLDRLVALRGSLPRGRSGRWRSNF